MKSKSSIVLGLIILLASFLLPSLSTEASDGQDYYASYWKCSDGNTYGLTANGNKRALYLPTGQSPIFFSGLKKGDTYVGTVFQGRQRIPVSGPITNNSTRVTLRAADGRSWVLNFSHK